MRILTRIGVFAVLTLVIAACGLIRVEGPNENRPERFEFTPVEANRQEVEAALEEMMGPEELVAGSVEPLGKYPLAGGQARYFARFSVTDPDLGLQSCVGSFGPSGGGWGCGPIDQEMELGPPPGVVISMGSSGFSDTWADAEFDISDEVALVVATAADGTTYRIEPISGKAWMEWRVGHGDLTVRALDADGEELDSLFVSSDPEAQRLP